jgi:cyclophilin family peptidyl-prolyl cis-trans isomerase
MNRRSFSFERFGTRPIWRALIAVWLVTGAGCGRGEPTGASPAASDRGVVASKLRPKPIDRDRPVVRIDTSHGAITIRLDAARAPGSVRNFLDYASSGFYDNTIIHFVEPGKLIAAGGYAADRSPKPPRQPIRNEAHNGLKNRRGTIAMARNAAFIDSATSQFFINLADAPQRDYQNDTAAGYGYCVFGEVIEGLDVAERISQSPTTNLAGDLVQTPEPPVVVKSIRLE